MRLAGKFFLFAIFLILIDQAIKLWMYYVVLPDFGGEIDVISGFFKFHYVTNPGMAFGLELGGDYGKILLSAFRIVAMILISYYLFKQANEHPKNGILWALAAILAGASGNLVDSIFYGVFLPGNAPDFVSTPWFHGQVIDMFYFYFLDGFWPEWIPFYGGKYFLTPIFNFADACIFCGVMAILLFQKQFLELGNDENP